MLNKRNFIIISLFPITFIILGFIFNTPKEIINGIHSIIVHPDGLLVDYIEVGCIGAAFVNSGMLMLILILATYFLKIDINGPLIAGIFTVGGFAFIGKKIYNVWPIFIGGVIYAQFKKIEFKSIFVPIMFATALSSVVTFFSFQQNSIPLGILSGIIIGILVPAMMVQMFKFHDGYNLYNIGLTCGILGAFFAALLRGFDFTLEPQSVLSTEYSDILMILKLALFTIILLVDFMLKGFSLKKYKTLLTRSGKGLVDQIEFLGFRYTYANMGFIGLITTLYVILVKGEFNGPIVAGILTAVGFAAFGKHPKNCIPIMAGVFLGGYFMKYDLSSTSIIIASLFGTTLAPIAGVYGTIPGVIAGVLHVAMVNITGEFHGWLNLYNNGFAGGIVAAFLLPVYNSVFKKKIED